MPRQHIPRTTLLDGGGMLLTWRRGPPRRSLRGTPRDARRNGPSIVGERRIEYLLRVAARVAGAVLASRYPEGQRFSVGAAVAHPPCPDELSVLWRERGSNTLDGGDTPFLRPPASPAFSSAANFSPSAFPLYTASIPSCSHQLPHDAQPIATPA
jgi:hypothetical protein